MIVVAFELLDGKPAMQLVFETVTDYHRFSLFHEQACKLFEDNFDYNDQQIREAT
jgi:hypothetical protein